MRVGRLARSRTWLVIGAAVASAALLGAACTGGSEEKATPAKGSPTAATKTSPTSAATPAATKAAATTAPAPTGSPKAAAPAAPAPTTALRVADTPLGKILVDNNGLTLYTFKNDPTDASKSVCNGNCANIWPPAYAPTAGAPTKPAEAGGTIAIVTRDDGTKMIAYNGLPLYRYQPDTAPGETKGEGVGGNWTVARP